MNFSVVILSRDPSNIVPCVRALQRREPDLPPHQIIVVDDGAKIPATETLLPGITWVPGIKPFIYARNANVGIRAAGSNDVILLNDDALLQTTHGFQVMAKAVGPRIGVIGATCDNVGNVNQKPRGIGLRVDHRMVCFVCVYIPRVTIDRVGLLDERYTGYGFEDDDYCKRAREAGFDIAIHDGCYVDHGSLRSSFRGDPKTAGSLTFNARIYESIHGPHPNLANPSVRAQWGLS